jgi:hypothetical protein
MPYYKDSLKEIKMKNIYDYKKEELDYIQRDKKEIYYIPTTEEIFLDYEEYINRIILYKQQIWTCKYTKKSCLSYQEALDSEENCLFNFFFSKFKPCLVKEFCLLSNNSKILLIFSCQNRF